jgi:N-(2-amino-2-carboxyethyl)-L-glutamate synthase
MERAGDADVTSPAERLDPARQHRLDVGAGVGNTPLARLDVRRGDRCVAVGMKLELLNATGSAKDRTAAGLLQAMDAQSPLRPGDVVVESTSGNLGLAMARILGRLGCRFVAVLDPKAPEEVRVALRRSGVETVLVSEPDSDGGYLVSRLRTVHELCARNPSYRWTNQYENPANPMVHQATTGPEIVAQAGPDLDAVYVAVSTGGTLAGISSHIRAVRADVRLVAVDARGSVALGGCPARRLLSGIGASRPSTFLRAGAYDAVVHVSDAESFAMCRLLRRDTGLAVGGSSGSVLFACLSEMFGQPGPRHPVCVFPDGGRKYLSSFYDDAWLDANGALLAVRDAERAARADGVSFELDMGGLGRDLTGAR